MNKREKEVFQGQENQIGDWKKRGTKFRGGGGGGGRSRYEEQITCDRLRCVPGGIRGVEWLK